MVTKTTLHINDGTIRSNALVSNTLSSNSANLNVVESNTIPSNVIVYTVANVIVGNPTKLGFDPTSNVILTSNIGGTYGCLLTKGVFQQITERGMAIQIE